MHSVLATAGGSADKRKCESILPAEICQEKRKLRSDKLAINFVTSQVENP